MFSLSVVCGARLNEDERSQRGSYEAGHVFDLD